MHGIIPSPNVWQHPAVYEQELRGLDPDGVIEAHLVHQARVLTPSTVLLDVGCGSGFQLPRFATLAAAVIGVEPHPPLLALARRRLAATGTDRAARVSLLAGSAQDLPVPDASVDLVHARWAYFFGPGCEPGLAQVRRVLRPGGNAIVIDNDATASTWGRWFRTSMAHLHPGYRPQQVHRFWARQGFERTDLTVRLALPDRATFAAVLRIEFPPALADRFLAEHPGCEVDYAVHVYRWTAPARSVGARR